MEREVPGNSFPNPLNVYANRPHGRVNDAYDSGISSDLSESKYNDVIDSTPDTNGTLDHGPYLTMDKTSTGPAQLSYGLTTSAIKYVKGPDYDEVNQHQYSRVRDDTGNYTSIDENSMNGGSGRRTGALPTPAGKLHLEQRKNANPGEARRRSNPLYDSPGPFPGQKNKGQKATTCCLKILKTICFLLSIAAIVLAIIAIVMAINEHSMNSNYEKLSAKYEQLYQMMRNDSGVSPRSSDDSRVTEQLLLNISALQSTVNDLLTKVDRLQKLVNIQDNLLQNISDQITSQMMPQVQFLKASDANTTNALDSLRRDFTYQINQIPHGLVNLSLCSHEFRTSGTPALVAQSRTESVNLSNSIVLGVVCSTDGGTQAFLEFDRSLPTVYTCLCRGQLNGNATSRYCIIHYWTCPIIP